MKRLAISFFLSWTLLGHVSQSNAASVFQSDGKYWEIEPNDTVDTANSGVAGVDIYGSNLYPLTDVFSFEVETGGTVTVNYVIPSQGTVSGTDIALFDANSTNAFLVNARVGDVDSGSIVVPTARTVYVSIRGPYTSFNVTLPGNEASTKKSLFLTDGKYWEVEPNNSEATANIGISGATTYGSIVFSSGDEDYFSFEVETGGTVSVSWEKDSSTDISLYDDYGTAYTRTYSAQVSSGSIVVPTARTVHLKLTGPYTSFTVTLPEAEKSESNSTTSSSDSNSTTSSSDSTPLNAEWLWFDWPWAYSAADSNWCYFYSSSSDLYLYRVSNEKWYGYDTVSKSWSLIN